MMVFEHSKEILNAGDLDIGVDIEKLNKLEQLGLYLLGDISIGRLAELWDVCVEDVLDYINSISKFLDAYKRNIKE